MSVADNKAVVRRLWDEVWNKGDLAVADEIFDEVYAAHEKAYVPIFRAGFPDARFAVQDMIGEHDRVVTRFTVSGTHLGSFRGVEPTGRSVSVDGIWIHRIEGGRIVEGRDWGQADWLGLLQQIGAIPDVSNSA